MCGVQKKHAEGALRILAIKGKGQFSESLLSESGDADVPGLMPFRRLVGGAMPRV
jgi:hypothetical protein